MPKITAEHLMIVKMRIKKVRKDLLFGLADLKATEDYLDEFIAKDTKDEKE